MEIFKATLNRKTYDFLQILEESTLFSMEQEDIDADIFLKDNGIVSKEDAEIMIFQKIGNEAVIPKFCYIIARRELGKDNVTIRTIVEKIIIDNNAISHQVIKFIFDVLLQQSKGFFDRIIVGQINERVFMQQNQLSDHIARYLVSAIENNRERNPIAIADNL